MPLAIGIAGAAAIFLCGRRSSADALLGALGLQVAAYLAACALSAFDPVWQFRSAFLRTSAALVPAVALLLAARLAPAAQETG
jgi:hypothetical protein